MYLKPALLTFRKDRQDSTGFSPFELVYGARPKGLLGFYIQKNRKCLITKINTYQNIVSLHTRNVQACREAMESLEVSGI